MSATTLPYSRDRFQRNAEFSWKQRSPSHEVCSLPGMQWRSSLSALQDFHREERLQVMRKAQLCYNCFKYGNIAVGCLARRTCVVHGCKKTPPPSVLPANSRARAEEQGTQVGSSMLLPSWRTNGTSARGGKVPVEPLDGTDRVEVKRLCTVDRLNASSRSFPSEQDARHWPHFEDINLPSISKKEVWLIIGTNLPEGFWVLEEKRGNRGEPHSIRRYGRTLMGTMGGIDCWERDLNVNFVYFVEAGRKDDNCFMQQVERFWLVTLRCACLWRIRRPLQSWNNLWNSIKAIIRWPFPGDSTNHSCLMITPWQNKGFKYWREGFCKMKNSLKVTKQPWRNTLLRKMRERYHLKRFM